MTVHGRILNNDACKAMLESLDATYGTDGPLNSVYKLQALVSKAQTPNDIETAIRYLISNFELGIYVSEDMGVKRLRDTMIDLMTLKHHNLN